MKPKHKSPSQKVTASNPAEPPAKLKAARPRRTPPAVPPKPPPPPRPIPPILLEGDFPAPPPVTGPGQRYRLAPAAPPKPRETDVASGQLPEAYGTGQLLLTARDPHWLYAHWDLTREQQTHYNALSVDHHPVLRVYLHETTGTPLKEIHLHPESRHWFVHVGRANTRYAAQLGYYRPDGHWVAISTSKPTATPPDTLSPDTSVQFATIPFDVPFEKLLQEIKVAVHEHLPLIEAVQQLRQAGHPELPSSIQISAVEWTPAQEKALAEVVSLDSARQVWIGSLEITELVRRQLEQGHVVAPGPLPAPPSSWLGAPAAVTSPGGPPVPAPAKEFWFNLNAELIVYGATEPGANVTLAGRPVKLRPDGTFSFRFALPDGNYEFAAVAIADRSHDTRRAELRFSRHTRYQGHVGAHPGDPDLNPPAEPAAA